MSKLASENAPCCHHWMIGPLTGDSKVSGTCKHCLATKQFSVSKDESGYNGPARKGARVQKSTKRKGSEVYADDEDVIAAIAMSDG